MAGTCPPIFGLKLPVVKARVSKQNRARLCRTEIVSIGHKRQVEKIDNVCQNCLLVAESYLSGANRLCRKKEKKKKK